LQKNRFMLIFGFY